MPYWAKITYAVSIAVVVLIMVGILIQNQNSNPEKNKKDSHERGMLKKDFEQTMSDLSVPDPNQPKPITNARFSYDQRH